LRLAVAEVGGLLLEENLCRLGGWVARASVRFILRT
jgi:hypothetical protein